MRNRTSHYRPDIDGLRAIAVIVILLYHAGFGQFGGGFVGVDIFFVISGFLITGQILNSVEGGTFSFGLFYERRIRRLMPAALATFAVTALAAYFILIPEQLRDFGASLVASIFWVSNIFFWQSTGYFDLDAHTKPLLHIWSLGVEEQFYLVWPGFVLLFAGRSRMTALLAIVVASAASLAASSIAAFDSAAVFYLVPFRIVEFGIGAALAAPKNIWRRPVVSEIAMAAGLAIIAWAVLRYTDKTQFPGLMALPPCIGAALLIYGGPARCFGIILRNPVSVWIGQISYSAYLVHWPIVVFYRLLNLGEIPPLSKYLIVAASLLLGGLMHQYIETPFRRGSKQTVAERPRAFVFGAAIAAGLLILPGISMRTDNGWEWRYPTDIREQMKVNFDKEFAWMNLNRLNRPFVPTTERKILLVGDSQAGDFLNMLLAAHAADGIEIRTEVIQGECQAVIPRSDAYYAALNPPYDVNCKQYHSDFLASGKIEQADAVVLAANWQPFVVAELNHTIDYYHTHGVRQVFIVGRKDQGLSGQQLLQRFWNSFAIDKVAGRFRSAEAQRVNDMLRSGVKGATYIGIMRDFCPSPSSCHVLTPDRKIIFSDVMHLTKPGTDYMASVLSQAGAFDFAYSKWAPDAQAVR